MSTTHNLPIELKPNDYPREFFELGLYGQAVNRKGEFVVHCTGKQRETSDERVKFSLMVTFVSKLVSTNEMPS